MTTNLTQIDVLRYVYNETNANEDIKIQDLILTKDQIADEFVLLSEAKSLVSQCVYSASDHTIGKIIAYAKSKQKQSAS